MREGDSAAAEACEGSFRMLKKIKRNFGVRTFDEKRQDRSKTERTHQASKQASKQASALFVVFFLSFSRNAIYGKFHPQESQLRRFESNWRDQEQVILQPEVLLRIDARSAGRSVGRSASRLVCGESISTGGTMKNITQRSRRSTASRCF